MWGGGGGDIEQACSQAYVKSKTVASEQALGLEGGRWEREKGASRRA